VVDLGGGDGADHDVRGARLSYEEVSEETKSWLEDLAKAYGFALSPGKGLREVTEPRALMVNGDEAIRYPYRQSHVLTWLALGRLPEWEAMKASAGLTGIRVLVAEDNATNRKLMAGYLVCLGCEMKIVKNGLEAVEAVAAEPFDVVLMDYQMPEMDGLEATRAIRKLEGDISRVPVIGFTAAALEEDRERCIESGMDKVLTKPLSLLKLEAVLADYGVRNRERS
jgi:CheY-like chemotaxis protein